MKTRGLFIIILIMQVLFLAGCQSVSVYDVAKHMDMVTTAASATQKASRDISEEEEYYVGRAVAAKLLATFPLSKNSALREYVNYIGQAVAMHSDKPFTHNGYHFAVLDVDEPNAFACPGGTIFITRGMIRLAKNEDELAAVLAHEVAHINNRDGISTIKKSRWTEALTIIGTTAVKKYGSSELSSLVNIFEGSIDDVFKTLVVNGYGQSQESRADSSALIYLSRAGYNPEALKDFLDRLVSAGRSSGGGILKTHPATTDRIENVMNKMPQEQADKALALKRSDRFNKRAF